MDLLQTQSFQKLLVTLASGSGAAVLVSFIGERWPWFKSLMPANQRLLMVVGSALVALAAKLLLEFAPGFVEVISPYVEIVLAAGVAVLANQAAYKFGLTRKE